MKFQERFVTAVHGQRLENPFESDSLNTSLYWTSGLLLYTPGIQYPSSAASYIKHRIYQSLKCAHTQNSYLYFQH